MSLTFQLESWIPFFEDARPIMQRHWEEIAIDRDSIKLSLNEKRYQEMDAAGILHVLAIRDGGTLIGYYIAFLLPHIHYQDAGLMAFTDIYFLLPEQRDGMAGIRMFIEAEQSLKDRGVVKAYLSTKIHHDNSPIFEGLGWKLSDKAFTKLL